MMDETVVVELGSVFFSAFASKGKVKVHEHRVVAVRNVKGRYGMPHLRVKYTISDGHAWASPEKVRRNYFALPMDAVDAERKRAKEDVEVAEEELAEAKRNLYALTHWVPGRKAASR